MDMSVNDTRHTPRPGLLTPPVHPPSCLLFLPVTEVMTPLLAWVPDTAWTRVGPFTPFYLYLPSIDL